MDGPGIAPAPRTAVRDLAGPSARFGRSLAVVIGIDTYGEGISPLRSAVADAAAIGDALQRDHGFETWCLFDDAARLADLLGLLRERLPAALGPDDRLVFYFAGHGIALDGDAGPAGYLVPARARRADRDGFLPMQIVHGELARLPVRHALVILDCCFAGAFRWSSLRDVEPTAAKIYRERYDRYLESAAWQVLTSASGDQLALDMLANDRGEGASPHSPFALAVLEALAGAADYTHDHLITADELVLLVRERVAPAAESVGRRQVPQLFPLDRHDGGQFVFQVPDRPLELAPAPPLEEDASPYRGLHSFRAQDRALFFGRDQVTARLVAAVTAQPLTVVVGPSGTGKSSVVHAGLVPALVDAGWSVLPAQRPGHKPLAALDAWSHALGAAPTPGDPVASWLAAITARASAEPERPWLIIVDQLEELLTHRTDEADRVALLGALASALRAVPRLHLVVTVRSDAEPPFHDTALAPWWAAGRFTVPAMTRDELRQIIERPASAAVLHFEPSRLVDRLIDDVALVPAPLPLLSFALSELYRRCWMRWQQGDRDRALREADYDELGSVARALTQRATALHDELVARDPAYAITIRNLFVRMVAVVGGEVARRRVPRDELAYRDPAENRRVDDVLQRFHDARLISLGTEADGDGGAGAYAEPTHDELVRGWTQVGQWLDELDATAGTRALLSALGAAVHAWRAAGRGDAYLWTDPRVELLTALGRHRPFAFNAGEAGFVERSARVRRNRRVRVVGSLLAVIVVLAVAAGFARWQRGIAVDNAQRAEHSEARAIAEATRATASEQRATANADEVKRQLARAYLEAGRQHVLDGHFAEAIPYLVEARRAGVSGEPIRMLFAAASRYLPSVIIEQRSGGSSVAFSPDGARIVTVDGDAVHIWNAATGKLVGSPIPRYAAVVAAFSPDGSRIVTGGMDRARAWDVTTGKPVSPPLEHTHGVEAATFSADGQRVITSGNDVAQVWEVATGKLVSSSRERGTGPARVRASRFPDGTLSLDGTRAVTEDFRVARVWDVASGRPVSPPFERPSTWVSTARLGLGGTRLAIANDNVVRIWDVATGKPVSPPIEHPVLARAVALSLDGTRVVIGGRDGTARVWDVATGKPLSPPLEHPGGVTSAAFSPDGTRIVTASDDTVRIWDGIGKPASRPIAQDDWVRPMDHSPDGTQYVGGSGDTLQIFDAATDKPVSPELTCRHMWYCAWSPDNHLFATASEDGTAQVWDVTTGKSLSRPLEHKATVGYVAFSRDGALILTASSDRSARVWDAITGEPVTPPLEHQGTVRRAAFSPDGTRVVTASEDGTAQVWDVAAGRRVGQPLQHQTIVEYAAFSPDGSRVVTGSEDHTARVWDAATGNPLSPPLEHRNAVMRVAFSPDGTRVFTKIAEEKDEPSLAWDLPIDPGTLADWIATAQRSSYELVNGALSLRRSRVAGGQREAPTTAR